MSTPPFVDLPADVRSVQIPTAAGPLSALRATPPSAAAAAASVLLVPGYTGSKEDFIAVLSPLAQAGYDVVALDQRGQNESGGSDSADGYTLKQLGADVLDVIDALGDQPVHLLGHSFGGLVAREAALSRPERIRTLTLLCSGPAAIPGQSAENARLLAAAAGFMTLPDIWAEMKKMEAAAGTPQHPDPDVRAFLERRFLSNSPTMLVGMGAEIVEAPDRTAELARLGLPLLVACGADDDAWPVESQQEMAERLGAPFHIIEDSAHSPAAENPDATVRLLTDFWSRHP